MGFNVAALGNGRRYLWIDPRGKKDERLVTDGERQATAGLIIAGIFLWALIATIVGPLVRLLIHAIRS